MASRPRTCRATAAAAAAEASSPSAGPTTTNPAPALISTDEVIQFPEHDLDLDSLAANLRNDPHALVPTADIDLAMHEYRRFLALKVAHNDGNAVLLSPSAIIDAVWHMHILDTRAYFEPKGAWDADRANRARRLENTLACYHARTDCIDAADFPQVDGVKYDKYFTLDVPGRAIGVATAAAVELDEEEQFDAVFPLLAGEMSNDTMFGLSKGCTPHHAFGIWTPAETVEATHVFNDLDELFYVADRVIGGASEIIGSNIAVHDDPEREENDFVVEGWPEIHRQRAFDFDRVFPHLAKWEVPIIFEERAAHVSPKHCSEIKKRLRPENFNELCSAAE
ncbi:hypothetical protein GGF32_009781 [Allomyces javanicus]|nr:hypothetical protein GGF32_009781 [Allomyces javanicus]